MTHRIDYKSTNVDGYGIVEEWITVHVVRTPLGWRGVCRDNMLDAYNGLTFTTYRAPCNGRPSRIDALHDAFVYLRDARRIGQWPDYRR